MPRGKPGTFTRCTIDDCDERSVGRGWCRKHYTRWHQHGDVETVIDQSRGICIIDGCDGSHKGQGYCAKHYRRLQRHGDPLTQGKRRAKGSPEERFWGYVNKEGPLPTLRPELGHCWLWTGYVNPTTGYGQHSDGGRAPRPAHTWGYEHFVGPIPDGLEPDHLCRNRDCVRFDHLEPVTRSENQLRAFADRVAEGRRVSHCPQGHPYEEGNVYHRKNGRRVCKTCQVERQRAVYADRRLPDGSVPRIRKSQCPQGHPYEEGNIYHAKGGVRICKTCQTARNQANAEKRKRMTLD